MGSTPNSAPTDPSSKLDSDLVARAYRKLMDRQELTDAERRAVKKHEIEKEERLRWQYYATIPQKHWRAMSGRQAKILIEQAERYGIPFTGRTIDLPKVVRAMHDFFADNKYRLARDDEELMQGGGSPALERYREERAAIVRLDRLEREQELLPRDQARSALGRIAAILRLAGDTLQRCHGVEAAAILRDALDDAEREIERAFGDQDIAQEPQHDDPGEE